MNRWIYLVFALPLAVLPVIARQEATELSGAESYQTYCASCHGTDGRGDGPAAATLQVKPPDLTSIRERNNGKFPAFRITHIIDGYEVEFAHGKREMPVWGDYFRSQKRDEATTELREHNLTEYLRSIQQ